MFSVVIFNFGQVVYCNSNRESYASLWVHPLMSSLSDRNMRLGDVLLPPGVKNGDCAYWCKSCLLYAKFVNAVVCCFEFTLWVGFAT